MTDIGLGAAASGLQADQAAMEAISEDLANVNTPGYVKTTVQLAASTAPAGGVDVVAVSHLQDEWATSALRAATADVGLTSARSAALSSVETALGEPSDTGLSTQLNQLWSDLDALGNSPSSAGLVSTVVSQAQTVSGTLNSISRQLQTLAKGLSANLSDTVSQDNNLLQQVADLNTRILRAPENSDIGGLVQQRNAAISQLSSDLGATTRVHADGTENVYLGGVSLVQGGSAVRLSATVASGSVSVSAIDGPSTATVSQLGGTVGGDVEAVDQLVPAYQQQLDGVAQSLAAAVNQAVTATGSTATVFTAAGGGALTAGSITVDPTLLADPAGLVLDGSGATVPGAALQQLAENASAAASSGGATLTVGGQVLTSPDSAWQQLVLGVGTAAATATAAATTATATNSAATTSWQASSGVDQNAELTTMLQIQNSYQASAKVLNAIEQNMQSLLEAL